MIHSSVSSVLSPMNATLLGEEVVFKGVSIDTRTLVEGNLYIAISGENFDGHAFCVQAIEAGAIALVVENEQDVAVPQLVVKNCRDALRDLAIFWRNQFDIPVVAVTGSSGKTTVKEMILSIFSQDRKALATSGNLNNELGVPLTLLRLSKEDRRAVIEIGANHVGEVGQLVHYVRPTIAVVTMVGPSHLEGFGSIEAIAGAKSEIYSGLQAGGVAVINKDDKFFDVMCDAVKGGFITFGMNSEADVSAEFVDGKLSIVTQAGKASLNLRLLGAHNRQNALAAIAVAIAANIKLEAIVEGLEAIVAVPGRLQRRCEITEFHVIDDTYNANPASVMAAIDVLDEMNGDSCLVLGDMAELGDYAPELHKKIGAYAGRVNKQLLCIGVYSKNISEGFGKKAFVCKDMDALYTVFIEQVKRGANVLVKGSRSAGMERFIKRLNEREAVESRSTEASV